MLCIWLYSYEWYLCLECGPPFVKKYYNLSSIFLVHFIYVCRFSGMPSIVNKLSILYHGMKWNEINHKVQEATCHSSCLHARSLAQIRSALQFGVWILQNMFSLIWCQQKTYTLYAGLKVGMGREYNPVLNPIIVPTFHCASVDVT